MTYASPADAPSPGALRTTAIGRVLFSSVFVAAGLQHLMATDAVVARLEAARLGFLATAVAAPRLLVVGAGLALLAAGAALLVGFRVRAAATVLAALLVPISLTALVGTPGEAGPLMKNVALFGGPLQLAAAAGATANAAKSCAMEES